MVRALLTPPRQGKQPPRICRELRRTAATRRAGPVLAVLAASPGPAVRPGLEPRRPAADPPDWLGDFVAHLAARHGPARACTMITVLGRLLDDEHPDHPQAVLERARRPGRSMGSLARALEDFFTARGLALPTDQAERLAAGRRRTPHRRRPRAAAPGCRSVRHVHAPSPGTRPAGRHPAPHRPHHRDRAGNRPRPRPVPGRRPRQDATGRWSTCTTSRRSWPLCPRPANAG